MHSSKDLSVFLFSICVGIVLILIMIAPSREFFGGPVKNIRKIPVSDCYDSCDLKSQWCEQDRPGNQGLCQLLRLGCRSECFYSNHHRV